MPPEILKRIEALENEIKSLKADTTIPFDTEQAFRERLSIDELALLESSTKPVSDIKQEVNEAGSSSYDVAKEPDGLRQWDLGGTVIYIPYYI